MALFLVSALVNVSADDTGVLAQCTRVHYAPAGVVHFRYSDGVFADRFHICHMTVIRVFGCHNN